MEKQKIEERGNTTRFKADGEYYNLGVAATQAEGIFVAIVNDDITVSEAQEKVDSMRDDYPTRAKFADLAIEEARGQEGEGLMADSGSYYKRAAELERELWPRIFEAPESNYSDDDTCRHGVAFDDFCEECEAEFV